MTCFKHFVLLCSLIVLCHTQTLSSKIFGAVYVNYALRTSSFYQINLKVPPTGTVTVTPSIQAPSVFTIVEDKLYFDATNYNKPQSFTIFTLGKGTTVLTLTATGTAEYSNEILAVTVVVVPPLIMSVQESTISDPFVVGGNGIPTKISFYLNAAPSSTVKIDFQIPIGMNMDPLELTFTTANYYVPQSSIIILNGYTNVALTAVAHQQDGVHEFDSVQSQFYVLGVVPRVVIPTDRTYAHPADYYFPVSLSAPPATAVTVTATSNTNPSAVTLDSSLVFTPDNWNIPQQFHAKTLAVGVAAVTLSAGTSDFKDATFQINVVDPFVRSLAKSVWIDTVNRAGNTFITLSAEPTSDVSCTTDTNPLVTIQKSAIIRGWVPNDYNRGGSGWASSKDTTVVSYLDIRQANSGAVGQSVLTLRCTQAGGSQEFNGVYDTFITYIGPLSDKEYYSPLGMRAVLLLGAVTVPPVPLDTLSTTSPTTTAPHCEPNSDNIQQIATLTFGTPNPKIALSGQPIALGYGTCQLVSTDSGWENTPSYYTITVVKPQIFADTVIYCGSGASGCRISFTFSYIPSVATKVTVTPLDTHVFTDNGPRTIPAPTDPNDKTYWVTVNGGAQGTSIATISFQGGEFDGMSVDVTVVVVEPLFFITPQLYSTYTSTGSVTVSLSGQHTEEIGAPFSPQLLKVLVTCISRDPGIADSFSVTFTSNPGTSLVASILFTTQGLAQFDCSSTHQSSQASSEFNDLHYTLWAEYVDVHPQNSDITLSDPLNFGGNAAPRIGTVRMSNERSTNGPVTLTLSVEDPSIASIDTSQMIFTQANWWKLQTFKVTPLSVGVTRIIVSGTNVVSNSITVTNIPPPILANVVVTQPLCAGTLGTVAITPTSGSGNYEYHWNPSTLAPTTSPTASQIPPGNYYVEITDGQNPVPFHKDFTINAVPLPITGAWTTHNDVTCNGAADGQLAVTPNGGSGTYTYEWTGTSPGSSSATANGLGPGPYSVKIHDSNNCPVFSLPTETITEPALIVLTTQQTDVLCRGDSTGSANVSVTGGVVPYTYSWLSPLLKSDDHVSGLAAATYTVEVQDKNHCPKQATVTITEPALKLSVSVSPKDVVCNGEENGEIQLTVSGGTTDYSYSWTPDVGQTSTVSNLKPGDYKYTVTDAHQCVASQTVTISQPDPLVATPSHTDVVCNGQSTGIVGVAVTGGNGSPIYAWNPSTLGSGSSASNLPAGIYLSTVSDIKGCKVIQNITVSQPDVFALHPNFTAIKCYGGYTNLSANPVGGTAPFVYNWYPAGGQNYTSTLIPAGIYRITASESCSSSITQSVIVPNPTPISLVPTQINVACNGDDSGSATVYASGGTPGYTYEWTPYGGNAETAAHLRAGIFNVTVTDANGCQAIETYVISEPPPVSFTFTTTPVKCYGASTGSASISVQGGGKRYLYEWNPDVSIGPTASNLLAGEYEVTVTDSKYCSATQDVVIYQPGAPLKISASQKNALCYGATGSAKAVVSGGTPGYTYSWSPSGGVAATATDLQPGTYVLTVTDANGCTTTQSYTITQPAPLAIAASQRNVTCQGTSSGVASAKVSGGTPGYNYSWTGISATTSTVSGLASGEYSVTVTDAHKCNASFTYTILEPNSATPLSVNLTSQEDNVCKGSSTGSLQVAALGGANGNYSYKWSSGQSSNAITNLAAGVYQLVVMDVAGCTKQYSFNVTEPDVQFCQNNATCVATETCICQNYWNGTDCSIPVCPNGCLHNGTCTGPNQCSCTEGFTGISCQKASSVSLYAIDRKWMVAMVILVLFVTYL